jgi:cytochrome P450
MPLIHAIRQQGTPKDGLWFIDLWPISSLKQVLALTPEAAAAVTTPQFLQDRHPSFKTLSLVFGRRSLTNSGGAEWKRVRTVLSTAFSSRNVMAFLPTCIEEAEATVSRLSSIAQRDGYLEDSYRLMMSYTTAFLCRFSSGVNTNSQRKAHPLTEILSKIIQLGDSKYIAYGWPAKVWVSWKYSQYERTLQQTLRRPILERWESIKNEPQDFIPSGPVLVADVLLRDYIRGRRSQGVKDIHLDDDIMAITVDK